MSLLRALLVLWFVADIAGAQTVRDLKIEQAGPRTVQETIAKRWALIVGISSYKNAPAHAQLKFAHRDAEDFARFLRSESGGGIPFTQMRLLTDGRATLSAIRGALHMWLPQVAGVNDVVYLFFAGHGVVAEQNEGYFVAHDSDPQNLHSTGLSFKEVNETLSGRLKSKLVIFLADACHAGSIGWSSEPSLPSRAQEALESIGAPDRSFLKLLASRPSERSYEDERWEGGHGVFTFALLRGLRGEAEQDTDGQVRVSELIEYVSRVVPKETESQQNPRVAGNFEPRLSLATLRNGAIRPKASAAAYTVDLIGPQGASVYLDKSYRGTIRGAGDLRLENVSHGEHRLEVELADGQAFEHVLNVTVDGMRLNLDQVPGFALMQLDAIIRRGNVLESGGAWDYYRSHRFPAEHGMLASAMTASALENIGQECINDYVQSNTAGMKAAMLNRSVEAFSRLQQLRPNDKGIEARRSFCQGRALIATGKFEEAVKALSLSLRRDPEFACAHNALGVALERLNRPEEARKAFERAFELTPEWFLPPLEIAQQHIAAGNTKRALPLLEKAVKFNPRSPVARWTLLRVLRVTGKPEDFLKRAAEATKLFPNYAPAYLEIAAFHDKRGEFAEAAQAYNAYLTLAPNFENSGSVKARADKVRSFAERTTPSLLREGQPARQ
jgi:uncharacterized caspase-like protein/tetratricopeptide (TPR) repeat protein